MGKRAVKNRFVQWSEKEYTEKQRAVALVPLGILVVVIAPLILLVPSAYIDGWLGLPKFIAEPVNLVLAVILIASGFIFGLWSVGIQFSMGRGTTAPMMPTHKLIVKGPYLYCRNPMTFGTILIYLGVVISTGSLSSFGLFALMISALLLYIKRIEEKELEARFGQDYLAYKKRTPFLIPGKRR
jgi:protein-S-isoprenylcysteine O-methyltransferase Ste14